MEQILDDPVPEMVEQLVKLPKNLSQDETQTVQTVEVPLLQFINKVVDTLVVVQRRVHVNRSVQETIEFHQLHGTDDVVDLLVVLVVQCLHWCMSWRRQRRSHIHCWVRKSLRFQRSGLSCETLYRKPNFTPSLTLKPKWPRTLSSVRQISISTRSQSWRPQETGVLIRTEANSHTAGRQSRSGRTAAAKAQQ